MPVIMDTGCHAAAFAARSARVDVVPGYPITPQTSVMEAVTDLIHDGSLKAKFIPVEGEHSVMAAAVAASAAGARVFTATSSQGLLYMAEVMYMASGGRLPVVMANVNRGVFAPWTLWADHQDAMSMRDSGWVQYHCGSVQEIYNTIIQAYYVAEKANIPVMVNFDGFALSHCMMPLELAPQENIDAFLPAFAPDWRLNPEKPSSFYNVTDANAYLPYRQALSDDNLAAVDVVKEAAKQYQKHTNMWEGDTVEPYKMEGAEVVIFAMGSMATEARLTVNALREKGVKAGLLRLRLFRPFPEADILAALPQGATVCALDRSFSFGREGGVLAGELKASLFGKRDDIAVKNAAVGIGGTDADFRAMLRAVEDMMGGEQ